MSGCSEIRSIHWSIIYEGGGDLRMYGHGFIYMDFCYLYVI